MRKAYVGIGLLLTCFASSAVAADQAGDKCSDILSSGTLKTTNWKSRDFLKMVILERFMKQTADDVKKDKDLGGSYGDLFSGYYDEHNHDSHQEAVRSSFDYSRVENHELDVALASGDEVIVNKWAECMDTKKTLRMRFSNIGDRVATLEVKWKSGEPAKDAHLTTISAKTTNARGEVRNYTLPKDACIGPNKKLGSGNGCSFIVTLPDATTDLLITVNSPDFSDPGVAYLPQRMHWISFPTTVSSLEPGAATAEYSKATGSHGQQEFGSKVCFNKTAYHGGYPVHIDIDIAVDGVCENEGDCNRKKEDITTAGACFFGGVNAPSGDRSCGCKATGKLVLVHAMFVPMGTKIDPNTGIPNPNPWLATYTQIRRAGTANVAPAKAKK